MPELLGVALSSPLEGTQVVTLSLREGISLVTQADVTVVSSSRLDEVGLLGQPVRLTLSQGDAAFRCFFLVVRGVVREEPMLGRVRYTLRLGGELGLLGLRQDVRMFQKLDARKIIEQVEAAAAVTTPFTWALERSLAVRTYTVQHRETDLAFVERLLADEGIFHFDDSSAQAAKMVAADSASSFAAVDGADELWLLQGEQGEGIIELVARYRQSPDVVTLKDYNYENPRLDLKVTADAGTQKRGDWLEFPGGYDTPAAGQALCDLRAEEHRSRRIVCEGRSRQLQLRPGRTFSLVGTPRDHLAGPHLVREVLHTFDLGGRRHYENTFVSSPMAQPYRPPRRPRPHVAGSQTVMVKGPPGEEIHTDALGRMVGKFHWDRLGTDDDKASLPIRVIQLPIGGSLALARTGWEMVIRFWDGDPDRPVAVARVDNGEHKSPYGYPAAASAMAWKTLSSPGKGKHNELSMEDGGGGMKMSATASKDWKEKVNNNKTEKIGVDEKLTVGVDHGLTIGANQEITVSASHTGTTSGKSLANVTGDRTKSVGAAETISVGGKCSEKIASSDSETVGASHMTLAGMGVTRTSKGSHSLTVGAAMVSAAGMGCSVAVLGAKSETVGGAKLVLSGGAIGETVIGAGAVTVGGVLLQLAGANRTAGAGNANVISVGGVAIANGGSKVQIKAKTIRINVMGVANFTGGGGVMTVTPASVSFAGMITFKAGSSVSLSGSPNLIP